MASGSDNIDDCKKLVQDLTKIMAEGRFVLRQWISNNLEVLENVSDEDKYNGTSTVEIIQNSIKTLGIYWNNRDDAFEFKIAPYSNKHQLRENFLLTS